MSERPERIIENVLMAHDYAGDGKCSCGAAIGHSDGTAWTICLEEHIAVMTVRALRERGLIDEAAVIGHE